MSQLVSIQTFADTGANAELNGARMNSHVNDATLLNGAVLDQAEKTVPVAADVILLGDSTVAASGLPKKVQVGNLLLESQRNGAQQYSATDSGAANAYAVTLSPAPTAYTAGMVVRFKAGNSNTTASTIDVNGLGTKTIKNRAGADLTANDILTGQAVVLVYDGTYFQLVTGLNAAQLSGANQYAVDGGAADAYTATLVPAALAYTAGMVVRFKATNANTTTSTLNVNALGVKTIKKVVAGAVADLVANDIQVADVVAVVYDGTNFILSGVIRSWDFISTTQNSPAAAGVLAVAHGLGACPTKVRVVLVQTSASAKNGYNQNDEVDVQGLCGTSFPALFTVSADATNVTIGRTDGGGAFMYPKTGGGYAAIATDLNTPNFYWKLKVYASL